MPATDGLLQAPAPVPPLPAPPTPYTPTPASSAPSTSVGYTPAGFTVTPEQTVQDQILQITGKDSPLMQAARTKAAQQMNARGLLNSSLAIQAGQEGVLATALPIAQQDAATFNKAMADTQNAKNAALQFGAGATNTSNLANAQLGTNVSLANAESANKAMAEAFQVQANYGLAGLDATLKTNLANLDASTKMAITQVDNQYRQLLQMNQDASAMFNQVAQNIAAIARDTTMTPEAKNAATQSQLNFLNQGLQQQQAVAQTEIDAVSSLNIGNIFSGTVGGAGSGTVGTATPIPGTNPVTSQWSDGVKHTPPASGQAVKVIGVGANGTDMWWGSDGKFYATQADAINLKNTAPSATPGTTPGTTPGIPPGTTPGVPATPPVPAGATPGVIRSTWPGTTPPPADLQWVAPLTGRAGNTPGKAGYRATGRNGGPPYVWVNANGQF